MRQRRIGYYGLLAVIVTLAFGAPAAAARASTDQLGDYVPDEVLVKLNPGVDVRAVAARNGLKTTPNSLDQINQHPIYRLLIADGTPPPQKAAELTKSLQALYAEPNYIGGLPEARQRSSWAVGSSAGDYTQQWVPAKLRLPQAHTVTRGADVIVAVLDTGVDRTHPALVGQLVDGFDFVDLDPDPSEEGWYGSDSAYGHGTHVAGLVALVAPDAKIMPLRTLGPDGIGTIWAQVQALRFAVDHGADVINLSYSFSQRSQLLDDILGEITCSASVDADCRAKVRPGAVVVAASGNSGLNAREYPAADYLPGILATAASTENDNLAIFSTYGSWVSVAAPGDRVVSTVPGGQYAAWSGTSMAAPLAAGSVALVRAAYPNMRPVDVVNRIATTAARISSPVRRRVDAAAALGLR
jgi:thermitase